MTDKSLIQAHCQGDPAAFAEILRRHGGTVLGYLTKMCANTHQAEDLFQETFKRLHEKGHTFRGTNLKPWLLTVATNIVINASRKKNLKFVSLNQASDCKNGNCGESVLIAAAGASSDPLQKISKDEQKQILTQAINHLPPRQRSALILAYYQQLSYKDVAAAMGCSIGTVKTQMYRALRTLAKKLPEFAGDIE